MHFLINIELTGKTVTAYDINLIRNTLLNDAGIKPDLINFGLGLLVFEKIKDFTA
jgi:hypothetical protein